MLICLVEIAAIASAAVAVLLVIIVLIHYITKRIKRHRASRPHTQTLSPTHLNLPSSSSSSRNCPEERDRRGTFTTWGFGFPAPTEYPPIAPSPSTGTTTLVTPSSDRTRLKKGFWGSVSKEVSSGTKPSPGTEGRSPIVLRPQSEEMVFVTYEEGLAKLGMAQRPHHILSMDQDPPGFHQARQAYPTTNIPRASPGQYGGGERGQREFESRHSPASARDGSVTPGVEERNDRIRSWVNSPKTEQPASATTTGSGRTRPGVAGVGAGRLIPQPSPAQARRSMSRDEGRGRGGQVGRGDLVGRGQSTWLPSYYHTPERRPRELEEGSELDYRIDVELSPEIANRWCGNRI